MHSLPELNNIERRLIMAKPETVHPYITVDQRISGGSPVIEGTRIRVLDVAIEYQYLGRTPDEIVESHPHLTLAQVHDAISYYYEHRQDLDEEIRRRREQVDELRSHTP